MLSAVIICLSSAIGCGGSGGGESASERPAVVFLGDSLTDGYTLGEAKAFPAHIKTKIEGAGLPLTVVNAGNSGDTTADALARLPSALKGEIALVYIMLGTNDARKRFEIDAVRSRFILLLSETRRLAPGARIALGGVDAFSGAPEAYVVAFKSMLSELAASEGVPYLPSPLAGVHGVPALNLPDQLHPTAEGHRLIAENVWPFLEPLLAGL